MPADADGTLFLQTTLADPTPTAVIEDFAVTAEDAVRDQLLESRIFLDFVTGAVAGVCRVEERFEIGVRIRLVPLKMPDLMKQLCRHDKHMFL